VSAAGLGQRCGQRQHDRDPEKQRDDRLQRLQDARTWRWGFHIRGRHLRQQPVEPQDPALHAPWLLEGDRVVRGGDFIVENNLLDLNRFIAIEIEGAASVVRRNNILNTGGATGGTLAYAIYALGDVTDNVIDGVFGADGVVNFDARGIYSSTAILENFGIVIQGNRIRNLTPKGSGTAVGITSNGQGVSVRDNALGQPSSTPGTGVVCADNTSHVHDNVILRYGTGVAQACDKTGGNSIN
jgi:hypothetical protein